MKLLSIIIPIYNVEKYIRPCIGSIFQQGIEDTAFEVILINDGSNDNSMMVIDDIINNHNNIVVVNQDNQGVSMARNNGIERACGEYILFIDPDDLLVDNSLSMLLEIAIHSKADLVVADFQKMHNEEIIEHREWPSPEATCEKEEKTGWELYLKDLNPRECYIWRMLIKREYLLNNNLYFTPGIFYEDIPFVHESYLKAKKCIRIRKVFYIYRIGNTSVTNRIDKRTGQDFGTAITKTWNLTQLEGLPNIIQQKIKDNVFISFSTLLYAIAHEVSSPSDRKQILKHLITSEPNLSFSHGIKQRIVSTIYKSFPYIYLEIRVILAKLIERNVRY